MDFRVTVEESPQDRMRMPLLMIVDVQVKYMGPIACGYTEREIAKLLEFEIYCGCRN